MMVVIILYKNGNRRYDRTLRPPDTRWLFLGPTRSPGRPRGTEIVPGVVSSIP